MAKNKNKEKPMTTEITNNPDRLDDVVDLKTVPAGEYKIRLLKINEGVNKKGDPYFQPRFEISDDPYTKDFTYYIGLPGQYDSAKEANQKKVNIRDFCLALGVNVPPTIEEFKALCLSGDLTGLEAWAVLKEKETEDFGMQNEISKFLKPA